MYALSSSLHTSSNEDTHQVAVAAILWKARCVDDRESEACCNTGDSARPHRTWSLLPIADRCCSLVEQGVYQCGFAHLIFACHKPGTNGAICEELAPEACSSTAKKVPEREHRWLSIDESTDGHRWDEA